VGWATYQIEKVSKAAKREGATNLRERDIGGPAHGQGIEPIRLSNEVLHGREYNGSKPKDKKDKSELQKGETGGETVKKEKEGLRFLAKCNQEVASGKSLTTLTLGEGVLEELA